MTPTTPAGAYPSTFGTSALKVYADPFVTAIVAAETFLTWDTECYAGRYSRVTTAVDTWLLFLVLDPLTDIPLPTAILDTAIAQLDILISAIPAYMYPPGTWWAIVIDALPYGANAISPDS